MTKQIKTLIDLISFVPDHKSCREFLEERRWRGVPTLPALPPVIEIPLSANIER